MISKIYSSPFRVYLTLILFALCGLFSGNDLSVSLFPNSSKPTIGIQIPYGNNTVSEFVENHGQRLQKQLQAISSENIEIEKIKASYRPDQAYFEIDFEWGTSIQSSLKEVNTVVSSYSSQFSEEVRQKIQVYLQQGQSGFFAASFYSPLRSLDELYSILEPMIIPQASQVKDAFSPELWNPAEKEIKIELDAEKMASFQLYPRHIASAVQSALSSSGGGTFFEKNNLLSIQMLRQLQNIEDMSGVLIPTPLSKNIHLSDVARIDFDLKTINSYSMKTSGTPSLILMSRPKAGGNVKKMSEDIIQVIENSMKNLPNDIQYKILVDPSEFIRAAIHNVFHEVILGAILTVIVLFLFIGNFKNTVTAAIEIPLSIILAFIPMKLMGMNINLISLGGLALSAGMNVDASVVVMENILRHFKNQDESKLSYSSKLKMVIQAVNEVKFSVIASTIASLVVFLPLSFTSKLTHSVLGDLANAVIFSHGFSAIVALILVPTIRLHLLTYSSKQKKSSRKKSFLKKYDTQAPLEKQLHFLENFYSRSLKQFILNKKIQLITYLFLTFSFISLIFLVIPKIPAELIGKPDTDWINIDIQSKGYHLLKQLEDSTDILESKLLNQFSQKVLYTFTQIYGPNNGSMMFRLKNKKDMNFLWKELEKELVNTPRFTYNVSPWNPAELPIPNPPELKLLIQGGSDMDRSKVLINLYSFLEAKQIFPRLSGTSTVTRTEGVVITPYFHLWPKLSSILPSDLTDITRVYTEGRKIGELKVNDVIRNIVMKYEGDTSNLNLESIPLGVGERIIPFKALSKISIQEIIPSVYQENQRDLEIIVGRKNEYDSSSLNHEKLKNVQNLVQKWKEDHSQYFNLEKKSVPFISFEDAQVEIKDSLKQLVGALILSIILIFFILLIQFGDIVHSLLVLVAIPLGFIGVILSLLIFRSTLSLNSMLGMILLNGIAVANSIILVDFLRQKVAQGMTPLDAAIEAAKKRLRPILITSITSILGMLPIAFGLGEGGKILQPLGIAVSGGLWVSMTLTLFIVPTLQVHYLNWKNS